MNFLSSLSFLITSHSWHFSFLSFHTKNIVVYVSVIVSVCVCVSTATMAVVFVAHLMMILFKKSFTRS